MSRDKKLSVRFREWHRDLGYLVIGITIIYSLSGIVLSFRDLHLFENKYILKSSIQKNIQDIDVLKKEITIAFEEPQSNEIPEHILKKAKVDELSLIEETNNNLRFQVSNKKFNKFITYDKNSGGLEYSLSGYPAFIQTLVNAHKSSSKDKWSYLALAYSIILFFLSVSAIFMVKGKYGFQKRGVYLTLAGIVLIIIFLYI